MFLRFSTAFSLSRRYHERALLPFLEPNQQSNRLRGGRGGRFPAYGALTTMTAPRSSRSTQVSVSCP